MRIACLLVPDLPLAAELRAHPEWVGRPLAIASGPGPRAEIIAVSAEAARAGVLLSNSVTHARAACAALQVRIASPALERAARAALLDAALSCSPRAASAPRALGAYAGEAAVYLDASGVTSLFHSEEGFAAALAGRARKLGLCGAIAVAGSRSAAHIAARKLAQSRDGPSSLVLPPGAEASFLAPLPVDLLDPTDAVAEGLTRFGVRSVGDLLRLPRRGLATRLGRETFRLLALARGEEVDPPLPRPADRPTEESIDLEFPVDRLEPLAFVLQGLLSRLASRLEARRLACGDLDLTLELAGAKRDARRIEIAAPTLDVRVLLRLVCLSLETRSPEAPVETVRLETQGCPLRFDQLDLFRPAGPAPALLGRILAELEALCGPGRVGAPRIPPDRHPDSFGLTPFRPERESESPSAGVERAGPGARLAVRILRPAVPARVRVRQGRPEWVESAVARGQVLHLAGPWRTTGAWWSQQRRFAYDSFDLQTSDGALTRLRFDLIHETWHVDAVYD